MRILLRETKKIRKGLYLRNYITDEVVPAFYSYPEQASEATRRIVDKYHEFFANSSNYNFLVSLFSRDYENQVLDVLAFENVRPEDWKNNLKIDGFVFENGIYKPGNTVTCENGLLIFSREIEQRRLTPNLEDFARRHVNLTDIHLQPRQERYLE